MSKGPEKQNPDISEASTDIQVLCYKVFMIQEQAHTRLTRLLRLIQISDYK